MWCAAPLEVSAPTGWGNSLPCLSVGLAHPRQVFSQELRPALSDSHPDRTAPPQFSHGFAKIGIALPRYWFPAGLELPDQQAADLATRQSINFAT